MRKKTSPCPQSSRMIMLLLFILLSSAVHAQNKVHVIPFLPRLFSQFPHIRDFTMTKAEDEAYFTVQSPLGEVSVIMELEEEDGHWTSLKIVPFSGRYLDMEPFLSPDGLRLYFASNRPLTPGAAVKDMDIWYVERPNLDAAWSAPINVGPLVNTEHDEFFPSVTDNGNLYFTSARPDGMGKDDIYMSTWKKKGYAKPKLLDNTINSSGIEFNAYVAPDESFMLFSCYQREGGLGSGDLYISHHKGKGKWTLAENMGEKVNSPQMDYCPYVHLPTKNLYFTSRRSEIKSKVDQGGFKDVQDILHEIDKYSNGLSRIYRALLSEEVLAYPEEQ